MDENIKTIEKWLGRKNNETVDPCRPSCAFMMDYETLEAIRHIVDEYNRFAPKSKRPTSSEQEKNK